MAPLSSALFLGLISANTVSAATSLTPAFSEHIEDVISDWITYSFTAASIIFIIYMVWNLAQAQFASFMNVPRLNAAAIEQVGIAVLLIAVAASARPIASSIGGLLVNSGSGFDSVKYLLVGLAQFALSLIIGIVVAVTFIAAVWNIIRAQTNLYFGRPGGISQAVTNLLGVLLGAGAVFLSLPLSSYVLSSVTGH